MPPVSFKRCDVCGKSKRIDGVKLHVCSGCNKTHYCSIVCQKADWETHKLTHHQNQELQLSHHTVGGLPVCVAREEVFDL